METDKETLEKINMMLNGLLGNGEARWQWWASPNKAFDLKTPDEVFVENPNAVLDYVRGYYVR